MPMSYRISAGELMKKGLLRFERRSFLGLRYTGKILYRLDRLYIFGAIAQGKK